MAIMFRCDRCGAIYPKNDVALNRIVLQRRKISGELQSISILEPKYELCENCMKQLDKFLKNEDTCDA